MFHKAHNIILHSFLFAAIYWVFCWVRTGIFQPLSPTYYYKIAAAAAMTTTVTTTMSTATRLLLLLLLQLLLQLLLLQLLLLLLLLQSRWNICSYRGSSHCSCSGNIGGRHRAENGRVFATASGCHTADRRLLNNEVGCDSWQHRVRTVQWWQWLGECVRQLLSVHSWLFNISVELWRYTDSCFDDGNVLIIQGPFHQWQLTLTVGFLRTLTSS